MKKLVLIIAIVTPLLFGCKKNVYLKDDYILKFSLGTGKSFVDSRLKKTLYYGDFVTINGSTNIISVTDSKTTRYKILEAHEEEINGEIHIIIETEEGYDTRIWTIQPFSNLIEIEYYSKDKLKYHIIAMRNFKFSGNYNK